MLDAILVIRVNRTQLKRPMVHQQRALEIQSFPSLCLLKYSTLFKRVQRPASLQRLL